MLSWRGRLQVVGAMVLLGATTWIAVTMRGMPAGRTSTPDRLARPPATAPPKLNLGPYTPDRELIIPVQGVRPDQLSDTFTQAREDGARVHDAIDIVAPLGTPVLAAAGGTIVKLHISVAGGLTIYQRSADRRTIYYYAHLDSYAPGLTEGQSVSVGQPIGAVGFTGNANPLAPHLHFAILQTVPSANWYDPSVPINPFPLLVRR